MAAYRNGVMTSLSKPATPPGGKTITRVISPLPSLPINPTNHLQLFICTMMSTIKRKDKTQYFRQSIEECITGSL